MKTNFLNVISTNAHVYKICQFKGAGDKKYSHAALLQKKGSTIYYIAYQYPTMENINYQYCGYDYKYACQQYIETII